MLRFKPVDRRPKQLPVDLDGQVQPGPFGFALCHLVHTTSGIGDGPTFADLIRAISIGWRLTRS